MDGIEEAITDTFNPTGVPRPVRLVLRVSVAFETCIVSVGDEPRKCREAYRFSKIHPPAMHATHRRRHRRNRLDFLVTGLICTAAPFPPTFELPVWNYKPTFDGGTVDQVLLPTGKFLNIPHVEEQIYVQPSEEVLTNKIDFTDPQNCATHWRWEIETRTPS